MGDIGSIIGGGRGYTVGKFEKNGEGGMRGRGKYWKGEMEAEWKKLKCCLYSAASSQPNKAYLVLWLNIFFSHSGHCMLVTLPSAF